MIQNIWAVGRNYVEHAKELGNAVPAPAGDPMIFLKAGSSAVGNDAVFTLPGFSAEIHHEVEIVLKFGRELEFTEITVGIDLTARDAQDRAKKAGHPWTLAKSFKQAALLGDFKPLPKTDLQNLDFDLKINGASRQVGNTRNMIHSIEKIRKFVIDNFPVVPGDIVMTGTPKCVAKVEPGDHLEAEIKGIVKAAWRAAKA